MKIGGVDINRKVGGVQVNEVRLGNVLIWQNSFFANSLLFDGVNDSVDNIGLSLSGLSFSISFWFEMGETGSTQGLFSDGTSSLFLRGNNQMRINDSSNQAINIEVTTSINQKRHGLVVYDGTDIQAFFDGSEVLSKTTSSGFTGIDALGIRSANLFKGKLNEVAIAPNYAATTQDAIDLYNNGDGALATNILTGVSRYYRCNQSDGSTSLTDTTGNQNGTLNNFTSPPAYFVPWNEYLLKEDGDNLLLETGDKIIL